MKKRAHIFVYGTVQGVGFRMFTYKIAKSIGLKGFVRNLPDGRVEIVVEGEEERIRELIKNVEKGPPLARVDKLSIEWEEYKGEFKDFRIIF